jgi:hypothetical protein
MKSCAAAWRAAASISAWGVGPGVGDVGADGVVEQERLLGDQGDLVAQGGQGQVAHVVAVDAHPPGADVVEARDQVQDGALAAAGRADQGDGLAAPASRLTPLQRRRALGA